MITNTIQIVCTTDTEYNDAIKKQKENANLRENYYTNGSIGKEPPRIVVIDYRMIY